MHIRGLKEIVYIGAVAGNLLAMLLALGNGFVAGGWRFGLSVAISSLAMFTVVTVHYVVAANLERLHHATRKMIAEANVAEALLTRINRAGDDINISADYRKM